MNADVFFTVAFAVLTTVLVIAVLVFVVPRLRRADDERNRDAS